jgi:hypothetical protein
MNAYRSLAKTAEFAKTCLLVSNATATPVSMVNTVKSLPTIVRHLPAKTREHA